MSDHRNQTLGQYIKRTREGKNLTLRQLCERSGVSNSYISQLENDGFAKTKKTISPTIETIAKLAKGLEIPLGLFLLESGQIETWDYYGNTPNEIAEATADYLHTSGLKLNSEDLDTLKIFTKYLVEARTQNESNSDDVDQHEMIVLDHGKLRPIVDVIREISPQLSIPVEFVRVPILGAVHAEDNSISRQEIIGEEVVDKKNLNNVNLDHYFWLQVKDDSMQPEIYPEDLALVFEQPDVDYSGQLAVIIINGNEGVIKRVHRSNDNLILHSVNPAYPPRLISGPDLDHVKIAGKVVEIKRKFK